MFQRHHSIKSAFTVADFAAVVAVGSMLALIAPVQASADSAAKIPPVRSSTAGSSMKAAPMKSDGSGIAVQYRIDGTPEAGVAVPVVLTFAGVNDPAGGMLRLTTEGGLTIGAAPATRVLPAGQVTTITVDVVPAAEGFSYLHVFTTQNGATSATSITVQVGKAPTALPPAGELKQEAGGNKIRSMQVK